jgi:hypothetical protein
VHLVGIRCAPCLGIGTRKAVSFCPPLVPLKESVWASRTWTGDPLDSVAAWEH